MVQTNGVQMSREEVKQDVEILREDVKDAKAAMKKIGADVGTVVRDSVAHGKRAAEKAGTEVSRVTQESAAAAAAEFEALRESAGRTYAAVKSDVSARIEERPVTYLAAAFFAGLCFGKLTSRH